MSTSHLHTSDPIALHYLMSETIFAIETPAASTATGDGGAASLDFTFYGKNQRGYLFLVQDDQHQWMSAPALEAFTKTLAALKLTVDDVALLNLATLPTLRAEQLISFFSPGVIVLLGILPGSIGVDMPAASVADHKGITMFATVSFDQMLGNGERKKEFWTTIKTLLV